MSLVNIKIENFKSIKNCNINVSEKNLFIGENGGGKSNVLEAINYFYSNLTGSQMRDDIFDENNHFSNEVKIALKYDLSEFIKIAKANIKEDEFIEDEDIVETKKYMGYYKAILSLRARTEKNTISIELTQIKGKSLKWNFKYEIRQIIKSLYPLFYIDSRNLDVVEWGYIWDMFEELGKVSNDERKRLEGEIQSLLLDDKNEISNKLRSIENVLNASDASVKRDSSKIFARNLIKLFFSGENIHKNGKRLEYYSTGTNAVKYIEILLMSINEISKTKLKEPIILIDEPEISLHNQFIDELAEVICNVTDRASILIATHSSRLTKNVMLGVDSPFLFNVKLVSKYTKISKMNTFIQYSPRSKYRVTDDHINSYFSKAIIFVEGESELELFSNPYLKVLFPILKKIDIFKALSEKPVLNIMNPSKVGVSIPYVILIDMDKAMDYNINKRQFFFKGEYIKSEGKEHFRFRNKKDNDIYLLHKYIRITSAAKKLKVHYYLPFYSCKDLNYYDFLNAVKDYLLSYNVFAFATTIEGALITKNSFDFTIDFLNRRCKANEDDFKDFKLVLEKYYPNDKLNALRYVFKGKSDLLQYKQIQILDKEEKKTLEKMQGYVKKASGWISDFLDYFFEEQTENDNKFSISSFQKYLKTEENKLKVQQSFKIYFPEIYSVIDHLYDIIQ